MIEFLAQMPTDTMNFAVACSAGGEAA